MTFSAGGGFIQGVSQQLSGSVPALTVLGSTSSLVSIDALEEFKIQTSTYAAEFGREPGAQVQLVTRSGTNDFHGTAFEYLRNEAFDANDWFTNSRPLTSQQIAQGLTKQKRAPLRQSQFGGTFSGPVFLPRFGEGDKAYWSGRNKTLFFFSYEGLRLRLPSTVNGFVPSVRLRQIAAPGFQPILNSFPVPTGPEATRLVGGVSVPSGFAPFAASYSNPSSVNSTSIRIDHLVSSKFTLFGRYGETTSSTLGRRSGLNILQGDKGNVRTLTLGVTQILTPQLNNEFRLNLSRTRGQFTSFMDNFGGAIPIDPSVLELGYSGVGIKNATAIFIVPGAAMSATAGDQQDSYQRQINVVDNMSWAKGMHQFKFGIDYRRLAPTYGPAQYFAQMVVSGESNLVLGNVSTLVIQARRGVRPRFNNLSSYAQETWKISPRLTLSVGLRWELDPAPHDANGLKPANVVGVINLPTATLAPPDAPFYKTFWTAFAPRVGAAYQLNQSGGRETVLRGGFGIYYDLGSGQALQGFGGFPFIASKVQRNVPFPVPASQAAPPAFSALTPNQSFSALDPELRLPYTLQWNVSLEQSLGKNQTVTASYVASAARHLLTVQNLNNQPLNPLTGDLLPRPNANFGNISYITNGPTSDYQSLQVQFQRRMTRGLQALINYTWSHAIDEASDEVSDGTTLDRGNADFDVRHIFSVAATYDIPKLRGWPVLAPVFRNWSLDSTLYIQSGTPINLNAGNVPTADGRLVSVRPDLVTGVPIWISDPAAPGGRRINISAFSIPPTFPGTDFFVRQGTLGRNVVRLPGLYQVNLALRRQFDLSERWKLQLKAEAFNLFNHPLFGGYDANFEPGSSTFGVAQTTLNRSLSGLSSLYQMGGPRSMQFSLRLGF